MYLYESYLDEYYLVDEILVDYSSLIGQVETTDELLELINRERIDNEDLEILITELEESQWKEMC